MHSIYYRKLFSPLSTIYWYDEIDDDNQQILDSQARVSRTTAAEMLLGIRFGFRYWQQHFYREIDVECCV